MASLFAVIFLAVFFAIVIARRPGRFLFWMLTSFVGIFIILFAWATVYNNWIMPNQASVAAPQHTAKQR